MYKILLLDDEQNVLLALQRSLKSVAKEMEMTMELFNSPQDAIKRLSNTAFDFIISDYHMPGMIFIVDVRQADAEMIAILEYWLLLVKHNAYSTIADSVSVHLPIAHHPILIQAGRLP